MRATDVPTYVQYGAADSASPATTCCIEHGGDGLYEPLDLNIAKCRMMVAVPEGFDYEAAVRRGARLRVATKYVQTAREHFAAKGVHVDLIKLYGSMELAPLVGLADAIVDLVSTGGTLKANNLVAVEEIVEHQSAAGRQPGRAQAQARRLQPMIERPSLLRRVGESRTNAMAGIIAHATPCDADFTGNLDALLAISRPPADDGMDAAPVAR